MTDEELARNERNDSITWLHAFSYYLDWYHNVLKRT